MGFDYDYDIALLKLNNQKTSNYLQFWDSSSVSAGEKVYALGSPEQLEFTVTSGIISAKNRAGLRDENLKSYLQTDAPLNSGNSGGPLINENGLVVGISTFGYAPWYAEGLYFALESKKAEELINTVRRIYETTEGKRDITVQQFPNQIIEAYSNFDINWDTDSEGLTSGFIFREVTVNLENKDTNPHNICFSFELIKGAKVESNKKLDSKLSLALEEKKSFIVPIYISKKEVTELANYYFGFNVFDCDTDEIYNRASMVTTKMVQGYGKFYILDG